MNPFGPQVLAPAGKVLLMGAFAVTLIQAMRGKMDLPTVFERLVLGFLCLAFFDSAATKLDDLSMTLVDLLERSGKNDLKSFLLDGLSRATKEGNVTGGINIPNVIEQAWRIGVWGVMASLVEGFFLIVAFVLECARDVLWKLLWFTFPLGCGLAPIFPKLLANLWLYAVELTLWFPALVFIEKVTGVVARERVNESGALGLYLVGVEIIAIVLIIMIPSLVHRFLSAAVSTDFNAQSSLFLWVRRTMTQVRPMTAPVTTGGAGK